MKRREKSRPNLTRKQAEVLETIRKFIAEHGISPTLHEVGEAMGTHRVTVFEHVRELDRKGWITTDPRQSRSIQIVEPPHLTSPPGPAVLGTVAAGAPIEAIESRSSQDLLGILPHSDTTFLLRVQGDSMIEDHIRDGDYVLVESRPSARPGETVVALIRGDETTLKRFYSQGDKIRLEPRNPALQPIVLPARDVAIQGVVVGVIRRC